MRERVAGTAACRANFVAGVWNWPAAWRVMRDGEWSAAAWLGAHGAWLGTTPPSPGPQSRLTKNGTRSHADQQPAAIPRHDAARSRCARSESRRPMLTTRRRMLV